MPDEELPTLPDLLTGIAARGLDPDIASGVIMKWRNEKRQEAEALPFMTERWQAVDGIDEAVGAALGQQRKAGVQRWFDERLPDPESRAAFVDLYSKAQGDSRQLPPESAYLADELNTVATMPVFNAPREDRMMTGRIAVGDTTLARYETRDAGDQVEVVVHPDVAAPESTPLGAPTPTELPWEKQDGTPLSLSIPKPKAEDLEGAAAEAEARAKYLEDRSLEIGMVPDNNTPTAPLDEEAKQLRQKAALFRSPDGIQALTGERIKDEMRKRGSLGEVSWGSDLLKGLADATFQASSATGHPFTDKALVNAAAEQLDTAVPGSTRNEFEGGLLNEAGLSARRSLGQMLPYMATGGALRASGMIAEGLAAGELTTSAGAFTGGMGSSVQDTDRKIAAAEASGDTMEAERLKKAKFAHGVLTGLAEALTERISPLEGFKTSRGAGGLALDIFKEGVEEPVTGFFERGIIDPLVMQQYADVLGPMPLEFTAGVMASGGIGLSTKGFEKILGQHAEQQQKIDEQHQTAVDLAEKTGANDDNTIAALVLAREGQENELKRQTTAELTREVATQRNADPNAPVLMWEKGPDGQVQTFQNEGGQWKPMRVQGDSLVLDVDQEGNVQSVAPEVTQRLEARASRLQELQTELDAINAKKFPNDEFNQTDEGTAPEPTPEELRRKAEIIREKGMIYTGEITPETRVREANPTTLGETIPTRPETAPETPEATVPPQESQNVDTTVETPANAQPEVIPVVPSPSPVESATQPQTQQASEPAPDATAIMHDQIDAERVAMGMEPVMKQAGREFGPMIEQARQKLEKDPSGGRALVQSLNESPRAHKAEEGAELLVTKENLERARAKAARDVLNPELSKEDQAKAQKIVDLATQELSDLHLAASYSGSETGRGLAFRKYLVPRDEIKPVEVMMAERVKIKRQADPEAKLTKAEVKDIQDTHRELTDTKRQIDDIAREDEQAGIDQTVTDIANEIGPVPEPSVADKLLAHRERIAKVRLKLQANQQARNASEPPIQASSDRLADERVNRREMRRYGLPDAPTAPAFGNKLVKSALAKIAADIRLPAPLRLMAKTLSGIDHPGLFLQVMSDGRQQFSGEYQPMRNGQGRVTINLRHRGLGNVDAEHNIAETIVHEVLHHATYRNYRNPQNSVQREAASEIDGLLGHIREELAKHYGNRFDYQTSTVDELISAIYTQREFQDALSGIRAKKTLGGKIKNALAEIFRLLTRLVVGHDVSPDSALAQAYEHSMRLVGRGEGDVEGGALRSPGGSMQDIHPDDLPAYKEAAEAYNEIASQNAAAEMAKDFPELAPQTIQELLKASPVSKADRKVRASKKKDQKTPAQVLAENRDTADKEGDLEHKLVRDLAKAHIAQGVTGVQDLIDKLRVDLTGMTGREVTDSDVRRALSNYGKTFALERNAVDRQLADLRAQARQMESIERVAGGQSALRTGAQRNKASEALRALGKKLRATMNAVGYRAPDAKSLKGRLDIIEESIRNEIESLSAQIEGREEIPAGKMRETYRAETLELARRRNALRAALREIPKNKAILDAQDAARAAQTALLMKQEYDRKIAQQEFEYEQKPSKAKTAELVRARQERDAAGALYRELRAQSPEGLAEAERRRIQGLVDQIDKLEAQIAGDISKPDDVAEKPDSEAVRILKDRVDALRAKAQKIAYGDGMDALREWHKKRLGELEDILKNGRKTKEGRVKPTGPEADALRQEVKDLQVQVKVKERPELLKKRLSERIAKVQKTIDDLNKGEYKAALREKRPPSDNPEVIAMEADLKELKKTMRELHLADGTLDNLNFQRQAQAKINRLEGKIARGDFTPQKRTPKQIKLTAESQAAKAKLEAVQTAYNEKVIEAKLAAQTKTAKALSKVDELINVARALKTSIDFSGLLRQGGFIALGHPLQAFKTAFYDWTAEKGNRMGVMLQAALSKEKASAALQEIESRPNADLYKKAKLFFAKDGTSLTEMEEAFRSRWAGKIPLVAGSERAYRTFLNRLRADSFDAMVASLQKDGTVTDAETEAIGNYINVATGRGALHGSFEKAAAALSRVFFAPKYVMSRFQLLLGQPLLRGIVSGKSNSTRLRKAIAVEYARYLIGLSVVYALGRMAMSAMGDDDKSIEDDPRSANFGKFRFGNTYIDPLSGMAQSITLLARTISSQTKTGDKIKDLSGPHHKFTDPSWWEVMGRFLRSKLNPVAGTIGDIANRKNMNDEPVTPEGVLLDNIIPLSLGDMAKVIEDQGVPKGLALWIASAFGMGLQVQKPKPKKASHSSGSSYTVPGPYGN